MNLVSGFRWRALASLAAVLLLLTSCGSSESSDDAASDDAADDDAASDDAADDDAASDDAADEPEEVTGDLRMLVNITPVLTKAYYEDLVAPWLAEHPGVEITIEIPSGDGVQDTLQQELASGSVPDVVASNLELGTVASQLADFPEEDWVLATPLAEENRVDDRIVQVATGTQIQSLVFYNKDAFAEAGITEIPKTVEEYNAAVKAAADAGYVGVQTSGDWVSAAQFVMYANPSLLGENSGFYADRTAGDVSFVGSAYHDWFKAYEQWVADGAIPQDALGLTYDDTINDFTSGKAATYPMGNWVIPSIDDADVDFEVGVFPTPTFDGDTPKQVGNPAQAYSIMKDTDNLELSLDLVEYLVSAPDAVAKSLQSEGNFRQGYEYEGSELNQAVAQILNEAPGVVHTDGAAVGTVPGLFDQLGVLVQEIFLGGSADDAAQGLDDWWDANAG
jgi:raffinose/stachyose/melibiose transport system substrate-binding protein